MKHALCVLTLHFLSDLPLLTHYDRNTPTPCRSTLSSGQKAGEFSAEIALCAEKLNVRCGSLFLPSSTHLLLIVNVLGALLFDIPELRESAREQAVLVSLAVKVAEIALRVEN